MDILHNPPPMTREQFMSYCWERDFTFNEYKSAAVALGIVHGELADYTDHCVKLNAGFNAWAAGSVA